MGEMVHAARYIAHCVAITQYPDDRDRRYHTYIFMTIFLNPPLSFFF